MGWRKKLRVERGMRGERWVLLGAVSEFVGMEGFGYCSLGRLIGVRETAC